MTDPLTTRSSSPGPAAGAGGRLRRALMLDAAGMAVVGTGYLVAAAPLGRLLGPGTAFTAVVGAVMLGLAAGTAAAARPARVPVGAALAVIGCGAAWIALSLAAVALGGLGLTPVGTVWTWLQIVPVAVFASWQTVEVRRLRP
ncbi:hypothetical protein [Streptomyces sp. WMMC905]|uniref:hypothetical protein n=1 Tax=Streptomyces sp. WMMC905 TaxID=3404123 RepID=UPI003B9237EC